MPGTGGDSDQQLVKAVKEGRIPTDVIDERVDEVLDLIFMTTEKKEETGSINSKISDELADSNYMLARKTAEESIVLLKNKDSILPLRKGTKVAIMGDFAQKPRYQGAGSSLVNSLRIDNLLEVSENFEIQVIGFAQGYKRNGEEDQVMYRISS